MLSKLEQSDKPIALYIVLVASLCFTSTSRDLHCAVLGVLVFLWGIEVLIILHIRCACCNISLEDLSRLNWLIF